MLLCTNAWMSKEWVKKQYKRLCEKFYDNGDTIRYFLFHISYKNHFNINIFYSIIWIYSLIFIREFIFFIIYLLCKVKIVKKQII